MSQPLSFSYKTFLVVDQLRKMAGISVPQLIHVLDTCQSNYSRMSAKAYVQEACVFRHNMELNLLHVLDILLSGYTLDVLYQTTLKRSDAVIDVLLDLERGLQVEPERTLIDCKLEVLLKTANNLLIA